jgi:hypothetical protein
MGVILFIDELHLIMAGKGGEESGGMCVLISRTHYPLSTLYLAFLFIS